MPRWLSVVGINEDGVEGLSPTARHLVANAKLVMGGHRHLQLAHPLVRGEALAWPHPMEDAYPALLARRGTPVVVLASGDPSWFGIGATLARLIAPEEMLWLPAPSAFSLACARLGWALHQVTTVSFCGRPLDALRPYVQPGARIIALSADENTPARCASLLREWGFGPSRLHVLQAMGGARERCITFHVDAPLPTGLDRLNTIALEIIPGPQARPLPLATGLPDDLFEHDGQITKQEFRALTLSALAPLQGELLWDLGCGSGSIGIEWMLRHPANRAIGIDAHAERAARAARNAAALGTPGLRIVHGTAPDVLTDLPTPDAVFIGGGFTQPGVTETAWATMRAGGRMVANAVTVETEAALVAAWQRYGGDLTRLRVERLDKIGTLHGFRPALTVTQWKATKP